jgi:hypothetical protein
MKKSWSVEEALENVTLQLLFIRLARRDIGCLWFSFLYTVSFGLQRYYAVPGGMGPTEKTLAPEERSLTHSQ